MEKHYEQGDINYAAEPSYIWIEQQTCGGGILSRGSVTVELKFGLLERPHMTLVARKDGQCIL